MGNPFGAIQDPLGLQALDDVAKVSRSASLDSFQRVRILASPSKKSATVETMTAMVAWMKAW